MDLHGNHPYLAGKKLEVVYEQTLPRIERIKQLGYNVKTIWEHDFNKLKQTDEMKQFIDTVDIVLDLKVRHAFYVGRVNGYMQFYDARDERIECRLYIALFIRK